jgi:gluconate 5-dehydrogenase
MSDHLFRLSGRRALVTGASRGIGRAVAGMLAEAGAHVVLHGRHEAALAETEALIRKGGGETSIATGELNNRAGARDVAKKVRDGGPIDILVNNAGINIRQGLEELTDKAWDETLEVDVSSAFALSQELAPDMGSRGWGRIINVGSIMSIISRGGILSYTTAKHAIVGLTRGLAAELGPSGVTVNAVGPGFVRTQATQAHAGEFATKVTKRIPLGRWAEPKDIGGAVVFLASESASYVNGHLLVIDGGFSISI